jgi:hypothetical protein
VRPFFLFYFCQLVIKKQNVLQFMKKYTKVKVLRISEQQHKTLIKMKSLKVDVGRFIREAIKDKIDKEHSYLIKKEKPLEDEFSKSLRLALLQSN